MSENSFFSLEFIPPEEEMQLSPTVLYMSLIALGPVSSEAQQGREERARQGYVAFIAASREYPASATAQSAFIANASYEAETRPLDSGAALLTDHARIQRITEVASKAHEQAGRGVIINDDSTRSIILHDFAMAEAMMVLPPEQITAILNVCTWLQASQEGASHIENNIESYVLEMIQKRRQELGNPSAPSS